MYLKDLIAWLSQQDPKKIVPDGFSYPHCDRGNYADLAFDPCPLTTFGEMLAHAKSADGETFTGWKGGDFTMTEYSSCLIGEDGVCGEEISSAHLKLWTLTARNPE